MSVALLLAALIGTALAEPWTSGTDAFPIDWPGARPPIWSDSFGTANTEWVNSVVVLRNGNVLAVGFLNRSDGAEPPGWDLFARTYTADGRLLWSRRIGGAALDAGWAAVETEDGRIAIAGPSASDSAGETDAWLLVLDAEGETLLSRRYGGDREDFGAGIAPAPDSGFVLTGWTQSSGAGGRDLLLIRVDGEGRELWRRTFGGPAADRGFVVKAVEGGFVVAGVTGDPEAYDFLLMKVDHQGELVWRQVHGGPANDPTHGLTILPDGRILLVGYTRSWGARDYDLAALTFSADGTLLRHELLGGPGDDRTQFSATAADGSTWIVGYTRSFSRGDWDLLAARVGPDGAFEPWLGAIGTAADENGSTVALLTGGDLLVGGYATTPSNGLDPPDGFVMRLSPHAIERRTQDVSARRIR